MRESDLAMWNDPDLSMRLEGVKVVSVVGLGADVIVGLAGGYGWWLNEDRTDKVIVDTVTEVEVTMGLSHPDPGQAKIAADYYVARLSRWQEQSTPLRLTAAEGRLGILRAAWDDWLPVPPT